jgi:hypothetical protein
MPATPKFDGRRGGCLLKSIALSSSKGHVSENSLHFEHMMRGFRIQDSGFNCIRRVELVETLHLES